jgi:hypothetical protein
MKKTFDWLATSAGIVHAFVFGGRRSFCGLAGRPRGEKSVQGAFCITCKREVKRRASYSQAYLDMAFRQNGPPPMKPS